MLALSQNVIIIFQFRRLQDGQPVGQGQQQGQVRGGAGKEVEDQLDRRQDIFELLMGHSRPLCLYFCLLNTVDSIYKNLPMTGFELQTSCNGSNHSTN